MKLIALTSAIGRKLNALKLNSVEPMSNEARNTCPPGLRVRNSCVRIRGANNISMSAVWTI